jgi:regulator of protease activity HflC (stomatin/prohibitin superfamily)
MVGFILALLIVAVTALAIWRFASSVTIREGVRGEVFTRTKISWFRAIPIIVIGLVLFIVVPFSIMVVPVNHALVIFNVLSSKYRLAREGITFVLPLINHREMYDLRRQEYTMTEVEGEGRRAKVDDSLWSPTSEGLQVGLDLTAWYRVNPDSVVTLHRRIGPDYEEKVVRPAVRSEVRHVVSNFKVLDVYSGKRMEIQQLINDRLTEKAARDGYLIDEIILRDVKFTDDFGRSIEEKQVAQQEAKKMEFVLEKESREAERKIIEAQGKAKAIEIVQGALRKSPDYINYLYVDKLSDKIKVIVSDQSTIMDLKGMIQE